MNDAEPASIVCPHCGQRIPVTVDMLNEAISRQIEARLAELRGELKGGLGEEAVELLARERDEYPRRVRSRRTRRR